MHITIFKMACSSEHPQFSGYLEAIQFVHVIPNQTLEFFSSHAHGCISIDCNIEKKISNWNFSHYNSIVYTKPKIAIVRPQSYIGVGSWLGIEPKAQMPYSYFFQVQTGSFSYFATSIAECLKETGYNLMQVWPHWCQIFQPKLVGGRNSLTMTSDFWLERIPHACRVIGPPGEENWLQSWCQNNMNNRSLLLEHYSICSRTHS